MREPGLSGPAQDSAAFPAGTGETGEAGARGQAGGGLPGNTGAWHCVAAGPLAAHSQNPGRPPR